MANLDDQSGPSFWQAGIKKAPDVAIRGFFKAAA
jgi:hypothetical protein